MRVAVRELRHTKVAKLLVLLETEDVSHNVEKGLIRFGEADAMRVEQD